MENTKLQSALDLDNADSLSGYRSLFHFPETSSGKRINYFCGNSLGLQPKSAEIHLAEVLESWRKQAVDGHFYGENPWSEYHHSIATSLAKIVGAKPLEVAVGNTLTVNLHFMMASFYRPKRNRYKILVESDLFPSDLYAIESHIQLHGYDPEEALIKVTPDNGALISEQKWKDILQKEGENISLVLIGGVNYYTGQVFPMELIAELAHEKGCMVGLDLAHAVGNVSLNLHKWGIDFAVWCNYKYLNSGPGAIAGFFVHERYAHDHSLPRLAGWWGQKMDTRFDMRQPFDPVPGAEGWIVSNPPIFSMAPIKASMEIFDKVGMEALRKKSEQLTAYLESEILSANIPGVRIITPSDPSHRGCQLSLYFQNSGKEVFEHLHSNAVIADWREPNVIRVAPAPLYNSYQDVFELVQLMKQGMS